MKKIGIIGGMSYESSLHYYERINNQVNEKLGDLYCAEMLLYNVNFQEIRELMLKGDWEAIGHILGNIAKTLEDAGANFIVIATNTMHKLADRVESYIDIPLLHIADCVSLKCKEKNLKKVGLLGTKYTMEEDFLKKRLEKNGLSVVVPSSKEDIEKVDTIIFQELCKGTINLSSKEYYKKVIQDMILNEHIEGVILGCTEIEMLIKPEDISIPIFDTTQAHIDAIVEEALKN